MTTAAIDQLCTRDAILSLLTESEIAITSRDEGTLRIGRDDEYVDLAHLEDGILSSKIM